MHLVIIAYFGQYITGNSPNNSSYWPGQLATTPMDRTTTLYSPEFA